ncbi:MAG: D-alanyl-D-alanine carboxypeptidase [Deltaproteobacteria bacterium]|nr:D-alanyl-D-alanine carboxypeptidase [Deltaproteobacteria bacterium]
MRKKRFVYSLIIFVLFFICMHSFAYADSISRLLGKNDAVLIGTDAGKILYKKNIYQKLVPASSLKVITALAAINYFGEDFYFKTDFYVTNDNNLKVKGYGDPFLISQAIDDATSDVAKKINSINDVILDVSYFKPAEINGNGKSFHAYESLNGALCANFNSITFKKKGKGYISAEAQTPLLPFVMDRVISSGMTKGRISLTPDYDKNAIYAGKLLGYFLKKHHCNIRGKVKLGEINSAKDELIHTFYSPYSLNKVIRYMLYYSNNYVANQLFLATGAKKYGSPADLEKGAKAIYEYLGTSGLKIDEGSGLSRENGVSAAKMYRILLKFFPYYKLMKKRGNDYYKTGTLNGVRARIGYLKKKDKLFPYVIILNDNWGNIYKVIKAVRNKIG